jgi:hypothetical protein
VPTASTSKDAKDTKKGLSGFLLAGARLGSPLP